LLGFQLARRQQSGSALEQVKRRSPRNPCQNERGNPVVPAKKRVTEQQNYPEDEHLRGKKSKHSGRNREAGTLADIAGDLRELDAGEVNLLPGELRSIFRHVAEELADSAIRL
jgi:hypothetical protein